jgi:outer membrane immunogenic protein
MIKKEKSGMARLHTVSFAALALLAAGAANAADLPARPAPPSRAPVFVAPVYNWTGFYIGINGGGGWAHKCWETLAGANDGCHDPSGGLVGGQVGFNWQIGQFVLGVEGDGDWANLSGTGVGPVGVVAPLATTNRSKVDALWAVTARGGYAFDAALLYVKGGGAWASDKYDRFFTGGGAAIGSASETRSGWTVGAGLEWGFAPGWSVGVEYDHYDFGRRNVNFAAAGAVVFTDRLTQTVDAVTARLNWRFGGGGPVVARY